MQTSVMLTEHELRHMIFHYDAEMVRWNPDENPNEIKAAQERREYFAQKWDRLQEEKKWKARYEQNFLQHGM